MNRKMFGLVAGLALIVGLSACSTNASQPAPVAPDAMQSPANAMQSPADAMNKGDAMQSPGDAMNKGDAMQQPPAK